VLLVSVVTTGVVALFAGAVVALFVGIVVVPGERTFVDVDATVVTGAMPGEVVETSVPLITSLSVGVEETEEPCDVVVIASGTTVLQPTTTTSERNGMTSDTD
jgi:hypothetical protein